MKTCAAVVAAMGAIGLGASAMAADTYDFTVNPAMSSGSYDVTADAPFAGTMTGNTAATPPTRTKVGTLTIIPPFVNCGTFGPTTNEPLTISGAISAAGMGSGIQPTGSFRLEVDAAGPSVALSELNLNLLGGSSVSIAANLANFSYQTFCTINPSCSAPFLTPITLPLGSVAVTTVTAQQPANQSAPGTLTPTGSDTFNFSIPVTVEVNAVAEFSGQTLPTVPQMVPITLTGTLTLAGASATAAGGLNVAFEPPSNTEPVVLPPSPFTIPDNDLNLCEGANLILALSITSTAISVETSATLAAAGTRIASCPCDWNQSGTISVQDIFDFLGSYFSGMGDFNGVGGTTVQDIFDFLACYFGPPAGCP